MVLRGVCVCGAWHGLHGTLGALSLSLSLSLVEEGRSTFGIMARPILKGLPKVSGVATNNWFFLRCD